jgi:eukaryotic-like serine/threonine-protein kinase
MPLAAGTRLGPYEILASIGAGGMGEVYRARDTRLGRDVALKILPAAFANDEARRARFSQEARTAGSLNHPGIVAVYDIGLADGAFYIATELVQGPTLRAILDEGALPQRKVVALAVQIAEAMTAAHATGITHRDLKPENLMVTVEGRAKILDFGLARQAVSAASADAPTRTQAITEEGAVIGTMGYMAPEQLRGKQVDARSDIFSFGAILYEMVAGRRAFQRDTAADSISAILREDPPELPATAPPGLSQIVFRCLEKEPANRFQSAADLAFALGSLSGTAMQPARMTRPKRTWIPWAIAAAALLLAPAAWLLKPDPDPLVYRVTPATALAGMAMHPALSPDGKQLAFDWEGEPAGPEGVYVKLLTGGSQPLRVSPADQVSSYPCWSPDGSRIAYLRADARETSVFAVPPIGGPERRIGHYPGPAVSAIDWSPDGKWIAVTAADGAGGSLLLISVETGETRKLTSPSGTIRDVSPKFSPDGSALAFARETSNFSAQLEWMPLRRDGTPAGQPLRIGTRNWYSLSLDWFPDGKSIVVAEVFGAVARYWKTPLRGDRPVLLPLELKRSATITGSGQVAVRGARMVTIAVTSQSTLGRLLRNQTSGRWGPADFYNSSSSEAEPEFSSDGKWVAFRSSRSGLWEIWRSKPDGSAALPITSSEGDRLGDPRWSPDGQSIVFSIPRQGFSHVYVVGSEGGPMRRVTDGPSNEARPSFSSDGKWIYFRSDRGGSRNIWKAPSSGGPAQQMTHRGGHEAFESADGQWLYYIKRIGSNELFRIPTSSIADEQLVIREPGMTAWAVGGNNLYLGVEMPGEAVRIERFDPATQHKEQIYLFPPGVQFFRTGEHSLAVSRDERAIMTSLAQPLTIDILLVDNFR